MVKTPKIYELIFVVSWENHSQVACLALDLGTKKKKRESILGSDKKIEILVVLDFCISFFNMQSIKS